jgi:hypothetical protein
MFHKDINRVNDGQGLQMSITKSAGPCCTVGCNTMRNQHAHNSGSNLWLTPAYATKWLSFQEEF